MRRPPIRLVELAGTPEAIGGGHGRAFAEEIQAYLADRLQLIETGAWGGAAREGGEVLELAAACLPAHEAQSPRLYAELCGLAEGAGITPAEAVVVGGFTDLVDTVRAAITTGDAGPLGPNEDDCTAFVVPPSRTADGQGLLGQTWDMHDTATDHVILLRLRPDDAPAALVFTTTGCLGQIGVNELGVAIGINNLSAADGRVGVTWPTVVRDALTRGRASEARDVVVEADLAGGHSYLVLDAAGGGHVIEAMPTVRHVEDLSSEPLVHTNHTLAADTTTVQAPRPADLQASSEGRLRTATSVLDGGRPTVEDLQDLTRIPDAICVASTHAHPVETSGAAIMRPATGELWATWGPPTHNDYGRFSLLPDPT
jgi:isopenicillin-N N-acyltransferase like protein